MPNNFKFNDGSDIKELSMSISKKINEPLYNFLRRKTSTYGNKQVT